MNKNKRYQSEETLERFRNLSCLVCGQRPSDPCHIKTRGSGGPDKDFNLVSFCRAHHTEQGQIGWMAMSVKYLYVYMVLKEKGWVFENNKLWNPELNSSGAGLTVG